MTSTGVVRQLANPRESHPAGTATAVAGPPLHRPATPASTSKPGQDRIAVADGDAMAGAGRGNMILGLRDSQIREAQIMIIHLPAQ